VKKRININRELTVQALAGLLGIRAVDVVKHLFQNMRIMRMVTGNVEAPTAKKLAENMGFEVTTFDDPPAEHK
jgi:hypothetical protein